MAEKMEQEEKMEAAKKRARDEKEEREAKVKKDLLVKQSLISKKYELDLERASVRVSVVASFGFFNLLFQPIHLISRRHSKRRKQNLPCFGNLQMLHVS